MRPSIAVPLFLGAVVTAVAAALPAAAAPAEDFSKSNMGLCSAFLAQLDPPPGSENVRALVNHLIIHAPPGTFEVRSPGELYRIRAKQHVNASAPQECLQR